MYAKDFPPQEELTFECDLTATISTGIVAALSLLTNGLLATIFIRRQRADRQLRTSGRISPLLDIVAEANVEQAEEARETGGGSAETGGDQTATVERGIFNPGYSSGSVADVYLSASAPAFFEVSVYFYF